MAARACCHSLESEGHRLDCPNADHNKMGSRDPVNVDYSQLSHVGLRLMALTQDEGNRKYGRGDWQKGLPISQLMSHAIAHLLAFQNGDRKENHLGHALWNIEKAAHFMETRPDLIDIPGGGLHGEEILSRQCDCVPPGPATPVVEAARPDCKQCYGTGYKKVLDVKN